MLEKIKELKQSLENQEATFTRRYFRIQSLKQKFQDARQLNESFSDTLGGRQGQQLNSYEKLNENLQHQITHLEKENFFLRIVCGFLFFILIFYIFFI